jgi:anti-sigma B factor antagonist
MKGVPFEVDVTRRERLVAVCVRGDLDVATAPRLEGVLDRELMGDKKGLVIDLGEANYVDAQGMRTMVNAYRKVREAGGRIRIMGCTRHIRKLFHLLKLPEQGLDCAEKQRLRRHEDLNKL